MDTKVVVLSPERSRAFELINGERDYQEVQENKKGWQKEKTTGEWIVLINHYTHKLNEAWSTATGDEEALAVIRKIAGIAVHCMEEHPNTPARIMEV